MGEHHHADAGVEPEHPRIAYPLAKVRRQGLLSGRRHERDEERKGAHPGTLAGDDEAPAGAATKRNSPHQGRGLLREDP